MKKTRLGFIVALATLLFSTTTTADPKGSQPQRVFFETKVEATSYESLLNLDTGEAQDSAPARVGSWRKLMPVKGAGLVAQHSVKEFTLAVKYLSGDDYPPQVITTTFAGSSTATAGALCNTSGDVVHWTNRCVVLDKIENIAKMSCIKVTVTCQLVKIESAPKKITPPTDTTMS